MTLLRAGMNPGAAVNLLRAQIEALVDIDPERKARRLKEIPAMVTSAEAKLACEREAAGAGGQDEGVSGGQHRPGTERVELVTMENMKMEPTVWTWEGCAARSPS
jgi:hypothetical protein